MSLHVFILRCLPLVMAERDGRNFRSFYYDTLGLKNVEQKKALEILLKDEEIGVLSPYQEAHSYMNQQRTEQFYDLKKALIVINQISSNCEDVGDLITKMYLMQEGGFRVTHVSEDLKNQVRILHNVAQVFSDMFEDEVDLYWLSIKFVQIQKQFSDQWDILQKIIEHYIQIEDINLSRHLTTLNAFQYFPYERIWDKVVAGCSKILGIVGVALLIVKRHMLLSIKESQSFLQVFSKACSVDTCVIVVNKAMELWDKHEVTINSEPLQNKNTQGLQPP